MPIRLRRLFLAASFFASACATTNAPLTLVPTPSTREAPAVSTPTAIATEPVPSATPQPSASPAPAPTHTPEPTATPPLEPDWHWAIHPDTGQVLAVNALGETRPVGDPHPEFLTAALTFRLDPERALVLVDNGTRVQAYLLTVDALAPIALPANLPYDDVTKAARLQVVGFYGDAAAIWYETFGGEAGDNGTINPPHGPLIVMDLTARTGALVDPDVNVWFFDDSRAWAHPSTDGRYLRYLVGNKQASRIRELDLTTRVARTVHELTGKVDPFVRASLDGSGWLLDNAGLYLDVITGQITPQDTQALRLDPIGSNLLLVASQGCVEPCPMQIRTVDGQVLDGTYQPPWGTLGALTLLLPGRLSDGALIFATSTLKDVAGDPSVAAQYPRLDSLDRAVFRLEPDGTSEILGILPLEAVSAAGTLPLSADGRFVVLLASDRTALRLFDLVDSRLLGEIPIQPDLEHLTYVAQFFDNGILVEYDGDTIDNKLQRFVYSYRSADGTMSNLSEAEPSYTVCNDLLADGSVLCWHYPDWNDTQSQFVRYEPGWSGSSVLLEGYSFLEVSP